MNNVEERLAALEDKIVDLEQLIKILIQVVNNEQA